MRISFNISVEGKAKSIPMGRSVQEAVEDALMSVGIDAMTFIDVIQVEPDDDYAIQGVKDEKEPRL